MMFVCGVAGNTILCCVKSKSLLGVVWSPYLLKSLLALMKLVELLLCFVERMGFVSISIDGFFSLP